MPVPSSDEATARDLFQKRSLSKDAFPDPLQENRKRGSKPPSSRGVANLTPDQLAKKRANDREAQRAIRERTKNQMECLERKIRDLTSQRPYQELQIALRQKELIEAENADLRRRLAQVMELIEPVVSGQANTNIHNPPYVSECADETSRYASNSPPTEAVSRWQAPHMPMGHEQRPYLSIAPIQYHRQEQTHRVDLPSDRQGLDFLSADQSRHGAPVSNEHHGFSTTNCYQHPAQGRHSEAHCPIHRQQGCHDISHSPRSHPDVAYFAHTATVRNCPPTTPLDSVLVDFISAQRSKLIHSPSLTPTLLGPHYPSFTVLSSPHLSPHSHPLSKVLTDILVTFPDISSLPEKAAILYSMFLLLRWMIQPTPANYDRLPHWLIPCTSQLIHEHPVWVDFLPFPIMRERIVAAFTAYKEGEIYHFEDFFIPFTTAISVNWTGRDDDVLVRTQGKGNLRSDESRHHNPEPKDPLQELDDWVINPLFEEHILNQDNWTLGTLFAQAMPRLKEHFAYMMANSLSPSFSLDDRTQMSHG